ncbi:fumarylacetoacetate hydrolase family protein [Paenarthrobacter sp. NPDC058040]|uniref:fumarylacetoacetate hydrolase family protein n=1 Tax=unclassified Paenarthrobacter TaxID=2634190 RepID=UPI0036DCE646
MKLLTFEADAGDPRAGALLGDDTVVDLYALGEAVGVPLPQQASLYVGDPELTARASELLATHAQNLPAGTTHVLSAVSLRAPIRPTKIIGVGLNYVEHVAESSRTLDTDKDLPTRPVLFSKPATAVIGHGESIRHDARLTKELDWECELAVVIGKKATGIKASEAFDYVYGYSIVNDISARDQRRSGQWFFSKGQDTYAPFGPWIVTADEITDPQDLNFNLTVNGVEMQNSNTRHMLFKIAELIEDITSGVTLEPGDVIATGSAQGVGAAQVPPQYLQPGDIVELNIEKIGKLTNPVLAV